ncbi:MAG TPA: hypothetical protein GXZ85_08025 [Firmicutes bacterium]|nr:hypothetical protein [Bacillota bacterium]
MRTKALFLALVFVLTLGSLASADNIDVSASMSGLYTVSLDAAPENSGIVFLLDYGVQNKDMELITKRSKGDMETVGDYQIFEGRRSTVIVGVGYEVGFITPWVGMAGQTVKTRKDERVLLEDATEPTTVTTDITEPVRGVALGVTAEYWSGPFGVLGTVAKLPEGVLLNARLKYNVYGIGTAHVGYVYNSHTGSGVVVGLGLTY